MNRLIKHSLFFTIFFILFYTESKYIGGIKIAILWKALAISAIIFYIFLNAKDKMKKYLVFGYLYSIKNFISFSSFSYMISTLAEVLKSLYIVLFSHFLMILNKNRGIDIYVLLITLSCYCIISCIPFLFNLIHPLTKGYDLSRFGLDSYGFVGIFDNSHYAASSIAFSIIVLIYALENTLKFKIKLFYFILIIIGLIVEIKTFARLGYAILFFGGSYLIFVNKSFKYYLKIFIPILCLLAGIFTYYNQSEALQMRLSGENIYAKSDFGSGRLTFAKNAIFNWYSEDIDVFFIGLGKEKAMDMMEEDVGLRIYAHNGFIDVLQMNGIIGMLLFMLFFIYLTKFILSNKKHKYYQLTFALFLGYLISMLVQGERFFLSDLIFAIGISLLYMKDEQLSKENL